MCVCCDLLEISVCAQQKVVSCVGLWSWNSEGGLVIITIQAVKPCYLWLNFHLALTLLPVKDRLSIKVTNFIKRFSTCTYLKGQENLQVLFDSFLLQILILTVVVTNQTIFIQPSISFPIFYHYPAENKDALIKSGVLKCHALFFAGQSCRETRTETSASSLLWEYPTHAAPVKSSMTRDSLIRAKLVNLTFYLYLHWCVAWKQIPGQDTGSIGVLLNMVPCFL